MGMQILALACLIGAIVLGFARKVNVGIVCLGLALILGKIGGIQNYSGHPYEFYQKCGYQIVGVLPDVNGPGKPDIFMAKRLTEE